MTRNEFLVLNQPFVPEVNPTCPWHVVPLVYWIPFAGVVLGFVGGRQQGRPGLTAWRSARQGPPHPGLLWRQSDPEERLAGAALEEEHAFPIVTVFPCPTAPMLCHLAAAFVYQGSFFAIDMPPLIHCLGCPYKDSILPLPPPLLLPSFLAWLQPLRPAWQHPTFLQSVILRGLSGSCSLQQS